MGQFKVLAIATAAVLGTVGMSMTAQAVRLADGKTYFEGVPRLMDATSAERSVSDNNVKYYFDLLVPADAGEPLQRVEITQQNGDLFTRKVTFDLEDSRAFEGQRRDRGPELVIGDVRFDEDTHTVAVTFDPPIAPGTDITIQLKAERNPRQAGIYLFGVTVYPSGENTHGQFIGFGRFHIYDNDYNFIR